MRQSHRSFHRKPTLRSAGSNPTVCTSMPSVVPSPSTRICGVLMFSGVGGWVTVGSRMNSTPVAITTMLLRIGANMGAAK